MKINRYGVVILTEAKVQVEGWLVEKEASDPAEATTEQMLLEVAIPWAQKKLNDAIGQNLQRISREHKAAAMTAAVETGEHHDQSN
jgi:hypothetical protein